MSKQSDEKRIKHILKNAGFPLRFYSVLFDKERVDLSAFYGALVKNDIHTFFEIYKNRKYPSLYEETKDYLKYVEEKVVCMRDIYGLYIYGPSYSGKTILACFIGYNLVTKGWIKNPILYLNVSDFLDKLRPGVEADPDLMRRAVDAELLILDDMGTQKTTEWVYERLYIILNKRIERMLPVIITSNYNMDSLSKELSVSKSPMEVDRLLKRLAHVCSPIEVKRNAVRSG